jgi:hypothetical protein
MYTHEVQRLLNPPRDAVRMYIESGFWWIEEGGEVGVRGGLRCCIVRSILVLELLILLVSLT